MTTRTAPSPAEILTGLTERTTHGLDGLVSWSQAATSVRLLFKTTPARSHEWLRTVLDAGLLCRVYVSDGGRVSVVYTDDAGKRWQGTPSQSGFGNRNSDYYFIAEGVQPGQYAATAEVLAEMGRKAIQAAVDADRRWREKTAADKAALTERHGDSIDVLRALLAAADLDPKGRAATVNTHVGDPTDPLLPEDSVTIYLTGSAIDAVAAVLREHGINR